MPLSNSPVQKHTRPSRIGIPPVAVVVFFMGCAALLFQGCFNPVYPTLDREEVRKKDLKGRSEQAAHDALTELDQLIRTASQAKRELAMAMSRADARLSELAGLWEAPEKEFLTPDEFFTGAGNDDDSPPGALAGVDDSEALPVVNGWTHFGRPQKTQELSSGDFGASKEEPNKALADTSKEPYVVNGWTYFDRPKKIEEVSPGDFGESEEWSTLGTSEPESKPEQTDQLAATPAPEPEDVPAAAAVGAPVAKVEVRILHVQPGVQTMEPPRGGIGAVPKAEISGLLPYPRESFLARVAEEDAAARREEKERRKALEPLRPLVPAEKVE